MDSQTDGLSSAPVTTSSSGYSHHTESSKELNKNVWINEAIHQTCSSGGNRVAYIDAVWHLECALVADIDKKDCGYNDAVKKCEAALKENHDSGEVEFLLARFKERELMRLIDKKQPKEVILNL
jgi:hypothetical protein